MNMDEPWISCYEVTEMGRNGQQYKNRVNTSLETLEENWSFIALRVKTGGKENVQVAQTPNLILLSDTFFL